MFKCLKEVDLRTYLNDTSGEIYYNTSIMNGTKWIWNASGMNAANGHMSMYKYVDN